MKDILVAATTGVQTSKDGKQSAILLKDADDEEYRLILPSSHLDLFAETVVELKGSLGITGALADRNASNELSTTPDFHRIVEVVGIVEKTQLDGFDLEVKTAQGKTLQLSFVGGQLQRLARHILSIDEPSAIPGEH